MRGADRLKRAALGAGLALAVGGAMMMQAAGAAHAVEFKLGVLVVAAGALASAVYFILQKASLTKYPPVTMTAWEYWVGFAFMALSAVLFVEHGDRWMLTPNAMVALLFSVIFNSGLIHESMQAVRQRASKRART